jgi:hypothetical protein
VIEMPRILVLFLTIQKCFQLNLSKDIIITAKKILVKIESYMLIISQEQLQPSSSGVNMPYFFTLLPSPDERGWQLSKLHKNTSIIRFRRFKFNITPKL